MTTWGQSWLLLALLGLAGAGPFAPHPGSILFRTDGQPDRVEPAASVPDSIKFALYDADGAETADPAKARRRVPVVEIVSHRAGAGFIEILQYGPNHTLLKSTVGSAP